MNAVFETLVTGERIAPFAVLAAADAEPVERPARTLLVWEGAAWCEIDPVTGAVLARGAEKRQDP